MDYSKKAIKMQGRDYLEVKWRIVWFREEHPKGGIHTRSISITPDEAVIHASVRDGEDNILGEGFGWCERKGSKMGRYVEKAETAAIGRALGVAGFGTQFMGDELEEGDHLADSPVESPVDLEKLMGAIADQLASEEEKADADADLDKRGADYIQDKILTLFPSIETFDAFCEVALGGHPNKKKHGRVLAWFAKQKNAKAAIKAFAEEMK